jgi:hypothetical protein
VAEREEAAQKSVSVLLTNRERLEAWRKEKNQLVNNVEIVLNLARGQIEVPTFEAEPNLQGAVLLTNSVIDKLNSEIGVSDTVAISCSMHISTAFIDFRD